MAQIILDSANNLIQGDFDTATLSLRTRMQTSTTNATTGVYVVPNGSATSASVQVSNAADPTNASKVVVATNGATDTQIVSGANGSGSYLPLSFYTNNDIRFQMGNAGQLNVRTAPGTVSSGTSGQFLTSGGPGAGVSWTTAAAGGFSNMQVFTGPGTFTTPATTTKIKVTVVGGGGGGGGAPAGIGGAGGTSSFGALASATGGGGGNPPSFIAGPAGAGSAGTLLISGGRGFQTATASGGSSILGGGGTGYTASGNGGNYGAGGGGNGYGGGGGGAAIYVGPVTASTPYAVTVGAAGAAGPGSGPTTTGGSGSGGVVIVEF